VIGDEGYHRLWSDCYAEYLEEGVSERLALYPYSAKLHPEYFYLLNRGGVDSWNDHSNCLTDKI